VNSVYDQRPKSMRRTHASGLLLLIVATVLAVGTVFFLQEWGNDPGAAGSLAARLLGSPTISLDTSSEAPAAGVPRSRSGLVLSSENRGQVLFGRYCDSCHTGAREMIGPSLRTAQFKGQYESADEIIHFVRTGGFDMPAYPETLVSDEEMQRIAEYILSLPEEQR
jgi:cytochrome c551/c552